MLFKLPKREVKKDEPAEVRSLMPVQMAPASGPSGTAVMQRKTPKKVECTASGSLVFAADFGPSISAGVYVQFKFTARESGEVVITWKDEQGRVVAQDKDQISII